MHVYVLQKEFEKKVDPNDKTAQNLLEEMRQHIKKVCKIVFVVLFRFQEVFLGSKLMIIYYSWKI